MALARVTIVLTRKHPFPRPGLKPSGKELILISAKAVRDTLSNLKVVAIYEIHDFTGPFLSYVHYPKWGGGKIKRTESESGTKDTAGEQGNRRTSI